MSDQRDCQSIFLHEPQIHVKLSMLLNAWTRTGDAMAKFSDICVFDMNKRLNYIKTL